MAIDLRKTLTNQNRQNVVTNMISSNTSNMVIPFNQIELGEYKIYDIDQNEIKDLVESIATLGLEQNLVVKETEAPNKYVVVTGHKRYTAIKYILDNELEISQKVRNSIETPMCVVIPKNEDELVTKFRMHETNVHQRKGFTLSEIEDYINTVNLAKKSSIEINGKKIQGTTRVILKTRFDISETTAKKYLKLIKDGSPELKRQVDDGEITINKAYDIMMGNIEQEENIEQKTKKERKSKEKEITLDSCKKDIEKIKKQTYKILEQLGTIDSGDLFYQLESIYNQMCEIK